MLELDAFEIWCSRRWDVDRGKHEHILNIVDEQLYLPWKLLIEQRDVFEYFWFIKIYLHTTTLLREYIVYGWMDKDLYELPYGCTLFRMDVQFSQVSEVFRSLTNLLL